VSGIPAQAAPGPGGGRKTLYPFTDLELLERENVLQPPNIFNLGGIKGRVKEDANVIQQMSSLHRVGMFGTKRIVKAPEPPRTSTHWDYVLKEMNWLATDYKEERKSKMATAKRIAKAVVKFHQVRAEISV